MAGGDRVGKVQFWELQKPRDLDFDTLDRVIRHTVVHQSSTSIYTPNVIDIGKTFCRWMDIRTDVPTDRHFGLPLMLLGRLGGDDEKRTGTRTSSYLIERRGFHANGDIEENFENFTTEVDFLVIQPPLSLLGTTQR